MEYSREEKVNSPVLQIKDEPKDFPDTELISIEASASFVKLEHKSEENCLPGITEGALYANERVKPEPELVEPINDLASACPDTAVYECPKFSESAVKIEKSETINKSEHMYDIKVEGSAITCEDIIKDENSEPNKSSTDTADESITIDLSPPRKRSKKSHFDVKTKELILNIYKHEIQNNPTLPIDKVVQRVASSTGVCGRSIYRIAREYKVKHEFSEPRMNRNRKHIIDLLDEFDKNAIITKVHQYFFKSELPTLEKVLKDVNDDPDLPNFKRTTFYKLLQSLNFNYEKCGRKSMLIEKDEIIIWRREYLKKIYAYRNENRKIYYLDETWVNARHTKPKPWVDNSVSTSRQTHGVSTGLKNPSGKEKKLIVCHIGSDDGFVPNGLGVFESQKTGDCHEEMDCDSFEKWFADILPQLNEDSVIVLDNAPYHSRKLETIPTTATGKPDVQQWLRSKNIKFEEDLLKVELLSIVKEHKNKYNKYVIDEMAEAQHKTVLRLPPYHCELNPIELIWADVKNFIAERNKTFKFADMENVFYDSITNITTEKWQKCVNHVKEKVETNMFKLDNIIQVQVKPLINHDDSHTSSDENE